MGSSSSKVLDEDSEANDALRWIVSRGQTGFRLQRRVGIADGVCVGEDRGSCNAANYCCLEEAVCVRPASNMGLVLGIRAELPDC
jgi:hypothetical protein